MSDREILELSGYFAAEDARERLVKALITRFPGKMPTEDISVSKRNTFTTWLDGAVPRGWVNDQGERIFLMGFPTSEVDKERNRAVSAHSFIEQSGIERGAIISDTNQFANIVNNHHTGFSYKFISQHARSVLEGDYQSIAPAYGTDTFYVARFDDKVIATTRLKKDGRIKKYKLVS
jgi:hypothetical protein